MSLDDSAMPETMPAAAPQRPKTSPRQPSTKRKTPRQVRDLPRGFDLPACLTGLGQPTQVGVVQFTFPRIIA
jgi:hypothetical protein